MNKEIVSDKQGILLVIMFIVGTSSIIITGLEAEKDLWLAIILSILMALPMILIYSRIHSIFLEKDLFDIVEICFGNFLGKVIGLLYTWFAFHLSSFVIRDFGEFSVVIGMRDTPMIVIMIITAILYIWAVKEGIEVLGRVAEFFSIILVVFIYTTILLSIPNMDINNIYPVLSNGIKPVIKGAFSVFAFPFAELIIFTMAFSGFKTRKSSYTVYIYGLLIGGIIILSTSLANILILGLDAAAIRYFPSYAAVSRLNIGNFLQRIEIIISGIFLIGGFIKGSICLLVACKGVAKIFRYKDYRFVVTPFTLLLVNLSFLLYGNVMEFFYWSFKVWPYYAFCFK